MTILYVLLAIVAVGPPEDALLFTPSGFDQPGRPASATGSEVGLIDLTVVDAITRQPTPCRVNVVGPDGQFYQPEQGPLSPYSLTGDWPGTGKGNREGKGPFRYFGRFFYSPGRIKVSVPRGKVRVEVWKGLEYLPRTETLEVKAGGTLAIKMSLDRASDLSALGYDSGDSHLHLLRRHARDESVIFDLLEAEDVRYGATLTYNEPAGPYLGVRESLDYPQLLGLGKTSERNRGGTRILSGQEYRSRTFGHLNLFLRDDLVNEGSTLDLDRWPPYSRVGRETIRRGGFAIYAHGGYSQAIYADFAKGAVSGVELLQFGEYRGIGLEGWYQILNAGYRFPIVGASDYPACRKLADCETYAYQDPSKDRNFSGWLKAAAEGKSFVTTGPLLLLEVEGERPGAILARSGVGPHHVDAKVRVQSNVAVVDTVQIIVNGKVVAEKAGPVPWRSGQWFEWTLPIEIGRSSWIAARAFGTASTGQPDAESHANPVYIDIDGKAPYSKESLDYLIARLDEQMAIQRARDFPEKAKILDDYQESRDILLKVRAAGGLPSTGLPHDWLKEADGAAFDPSRRTHSAEELAEFLKPLPLKSPTEALGAIETSDGFELQLVAAEPLLRSPVAAAFDENGNLYVCEMTDYPFKPRDGAKPLGSVRLLRDLDGDGDFDESHVFAEGLLWAAGVAPWKGGVFVASPPDIWYLKDTDGDHKADLRRKVFTGFGTQNEQGMLNNFTFGLDNKIYGSTSVNGGQVRHAERPDLPAVSVDGKDFRFDPRTETIEPLSGTVQFGTTFDDFGNRFLCSESRPLIHAVLPAEALARNPDLPVSTALDDVAGHPVPIFRISPLERWRQIRSARRIAHGERQAGSAGASHHVIDAAAGVTVYRGTAYPPEYRGDVFVNDAQNNLIHRMKLAPAGVSFRASRVESGTEFARSYDNGFRPVNLLNAPDGTLYVLDMSREVIEAIHIPLDVARHLDLRRGRDLGRIYRIAPKGFKPSPPPRLGLASTEQLVATLDHPDGWWRDTARRLLFERQDQGAVVPLRAMAGGPEARAGALWSLQGLNALTDEDLIKSSHDDSFNVVEQAVRLAGGRAGASRTLRDRVRELALSESPRVRFAVAIALGGFQDERVAGALASIATRDARDRWTRVAVLAGASECSGPLFEQLASDPVFLSDAEGLGMLETLAGVVGTRNRAAEVDRVLQVLAVEGRPARFRRRTMLGLGLGLQRVGSTLPVPDALGANSRRWLGSTIKEAAASAVAPTSSEASRMEAVRLLGVVPLTSAQGPLSALLEPSFTGAVQVAAVRALAGFDDPGIAELLIERSRRLSPEGRAEVIGALLSREAWTLALLQSAQAGTLDPGQLEQARRDQLSAHKNPEIARLAKGLFGRLEPGTTVDAIRSFAPALTLEGEKARGQRVFETHCLNCHKLGDRGHGVGPDLSASQFSDREALLTHLLEPNRYVAPNFVEYVVSDRSGRIYQGIIASESPSSLTLRRAEGIEETILRSRIEELSSTGKSLMPEDFATKLSHQDAADLLTFLLAGRKTDAPPERLDIGTLPGLIEPEP